jgi:hypothetical protein
VSRAVVVPVSSLRRIIVTALIVLAVVLVILAVRTQLFRAGVGTLFAPSAAEVIDRNLYQAVFLVGGQVFFGKLQEQGDHFFILSDTFYLSVPDQAGAQGQLIKRGNEIHGPKDPMIIPVNEVLFIENLRDDSQVATAIRKFKAGELPVATPPPGVTTAPITPAPGTARPSVTPTPTR